MTGRRRGAFAAARKAAGHTQESLAEALHIDRATVNRWEAGRHAPLPYVRPKLARLLGRSLHQLDTLLGPADTPVDGQVSAETVEIDVDIDLACEWLDVHTGWRPGASRSQVIAGLTATKAGSLRDRDRRRGKVTRTNIAHAISNYYRETMRGHGVYRAHYDGFDVQTTVLSRPNWLDLACLLTPDTDRLALAGASAGQDINLDDVAAKHAIRRLLEAAVLRVRMTNAPLYRLLNVNVDTQAILGELDIIPFVQYALTTDLVERELVDALADGTAELPLREKYLRDVGTVLDVTERFCCGGVLALCAIARPADPYRGPADYLLLVQERADHVLNSVGRLSVIPKGFHQPLTDFRSGAFVGATLRRELEEELFGRRDVDGTLSEHRVADPMHPNRLSEPMRWLQNEDGMRLECTGFGFNLVNGNYEFAGLVVIDDDDFWRRYGDRIEANWESAGLRQYSSLDRRFITELIADESWSNEGLFAFLQGLRRLSQIDETRVRAPDIEWELA
ncbi:helix-turn-helix transcriptional regulator [Actinophytocola sp.]|uniref:helix-turn-helix transcriptional regulator n=1 Tax=Actinophytocola sp. TaxID=1872138 RepID=UPI003D6C0EB2